MGNNLSSLLTEQRNERSMTIDQQSTKQILTILNQEDQTVALAVQEALPEIESATEVVCDALQNGGRLFYIGAGTSGRLGIIDASECPPTFRTDPEMVKGIIAGGKNAVFKAAEGAEDSSEQGAEDLRLEGLTKKDAVIGIAASGRTPYVKGALQFAGHTGAATISLSCNPDSEISAVARIPIEILVGPEVLTGSTRLKAATAQKMVLNMISTAVMIKLGKVYENLMVDLQASNYKLRQRAKRIVAALTDVPEWQIENVLEASSYDVKTAIVMLETETGAEQARGMLKQANGFVRQAIELIQEKI